MEQLGAIKSYDDLQAVCRAVAEQRQMSRTEIDRLAGFAPGLAAKLLSDPPVRHMGRDTLPGMLGALGIKLMPVDDAEAIRRFTSRAEKRNESQVRKAKPLSISGGNEIPSEFFRAIGERGGSSRMHKMTSAQRSAVARKGASARWRKKRVATV